MEADIILWAGPGLESFLVKPMENLPRPSRVINLSKVETLTRYFSRTGGVWEEDDHEGEHEQGGLDPHLWLDPDNAAVIAWMIAEKLAEKDFTRSETYRANARKFAERLKQEDAAIRAQLEPLGRKPFIVFHDAFQYFEKQYRLNGAGAITLSPDEQPSAGRVAQLRSRIEAQKVACVFAEPQFAPALLTTLTEGTQVKTGTLNPDASDLPLDANLYFNWLHRLADGFEECLK
jgi:zinc transport system substrate-binding protein